MSRRLVIAGALVVAGLWVLIVGSYLPLASSVICENNPDCMPGWWWPVVLSLTTLLICGGMAVGRHRRR